MQPSDILKDLDGHEVKIAFIRSEMYNGPVVNFMIDKTLNNRLEHVIFAQNLAVGDLGWQASLEDELNQVMIRQ